jgi:hypothetical protein
LAEQTIQHDGGPLQARGDSETSFSIAVHCLRQALRHLAFASSTATSNAIDAQSRFYTTHNYGAHFLNMMEMHNSGAYPVALEHNSVSNSKAPPTQYLGNIKTRYDACLTPIAFIWSWKICCLATNSLNVRDIWNSLSSGVRPRHVAFALLELLSCHMISLYRRGYTWIVMHQAPDYRTEVIPLFNTSDERLIDPSLKRTENGTKFFTPRYRKPKDWTSPPPELLHWISSNQARSSVNSNASLD